MGRYYRTVQEIKRKNPDYKYVIEIRSSAGLLGGFDVTVQGFATNNPNVDDNANFLSEWFWSRPRRDKLMELVDRLHVSVRSSMDERDWDKIQDEQLKKHLNRLKDDMDRHFRVDLERKLKEAADIYKAEKDRKAAMRP